MNSYKYLYELMIKKKFKKIFFLNFESLFSNFSYFEYFLNIIV